MTKAIMSECLAEAFGLWDMLRFGEEFRQDDKQAVATIAVALYQERCKSLGMKGTEEKTTIALGDIPIERLTLSNRVENILKRSNILDVCQVLEMDSVELLRLRNFGIRAWEELNLKLAPYRNGLVPIKPSTKGPGAMEALIHTALLNDEKSPYLHGSDEPLSEGKQRNS